MQTDLEWYDETVGNEPFESGRVFSGPFDRLRPATPVEQKISYDALGLPPSGFLWVLITWKAGRRTYYNYFEADKIEPAVTMGIDDNTGEETGDTGVDEISGAVFASMDYYNGDDAVHAQRRLVKEAMFAAWRQGILSEELIWPPTTN